MAPPAAAFTSIEHVFEGHVRAGTMINVIGIVVDFRAPIPTRKEDYKAQIRFYDESTEDDTSKSLTINIFRLPDAMPNPSCGDVVVIFQAKVQTFQSELSLMTNRITDVYVFSAGSIPRPPRDAEDALHAPSKKPSRNLTKSDFAHVSAFYHRVDKARIPTAAEYTHQMQTSVQVKEKFSLLKDVASERFVDVIVEVVKAPYDLGDKFTLWISDYTEHSNFFNFAISGAEMRADPYNYTIGSNTPDGDWNGPYGRNCLQITCWEPHADAIRVNNITVGSYVYIRNLQIKWGRNSNNLEGYLRGDERYPSKINISLLDHEEDGDSVDPRLKETIRRRREYERLAKKQLKSINEAAKAGEKRRAALDEDQKSREPNAKSKRRKQREGKQAKASTPSMQQEKTPVPEPEVPPTPTIKLNSTIKCENEKQPCSAIAELLEQICFEALIGQDAAQLPLPFINANYRANVRVKDFLPHSLEDFAFAKIQSSVYDMLSDAESASSDSDDDDEDRNMDHFVTSEKIKGWEWRFHLLLEDATVADADGKADHCVWVTVDNHAAQCLLNLNAGDLRHSRMLVSQLREKLFYLWGDLEELKTKTLLRTALAEKQARAIGPPLDSDDEEAGDKGGGAARTEMGPSNLPFSCCIRQYGVKVREVDEGKADAGEGQRWQRMYGLFGTQISVPDMPRTE